MIWALEGYLDKLEKQGKMDDEVQKEMLDYQVPQAQTDFKEKKENLVYRELLVIQEKMAFM